MQAVLYHHEADADTVASFVAFPEASSDSAGHPAARSGKVELPQLAACALWWCDADATCVEVALVSNRHDASAPAMSYTRHVAVRYSRQIVDVYVTAASNQGRQSLNIVACTSDGQLASTKVAVRRGDDTAVDAEIHGTVLHSNRHTENVVAIADASSLEDRATTCTLVATPKAILTVAIDDAAVRETLLHEFDGRMGFLTSVAFDCARNVVIAGLGSGDVIFARLGSSGLAVVSTASLGRGVVPRAVGLEVDASGSVEAAIVRATDSTVHEECVLRIAEEDNAVGITARINGFGGSTLATLPVISPLGSAAMAWDHSSRSRPLVGGVASRAIGSTSIHCQAVSRGPLRLSLSFVRAAFPMQSEGANGVVDTTLCVAFGNSGRCRLYHVARDASVHAELPVSVLHPSPDSSFGRLSDAAPCTVPVVEALPRAAPQEASSGLPTVIAAGAAVFDFATEGPDALRQLLATAVARASALPRSDVFHRVCADAATNGFLPTPVSDEDLVRAAVSLLDIAKPSSPTATVFDLTAGGVCYTGNARAISGQLVLDLQRVVLALIYIETARLSQRRAVAPEATAIISRCLTAAAAALAVVRACDTRVDTLVMTAIGGESEPFQACALTLRALLCVEDIECPVACQAAIVNVGSWLKEIREESCAIRATAAWTASWLAVSPLMRHFVLCDILTRGPTRATSHIVYEHMQAVSAAINSLERDTARPVVETIAPELHDVVPNDTLMNSIYADVAGDSEGLLIAQRSAAFYTVCMTKRLVASDTLASEDVGKLVPVIESFLKMALEQNLGETEPCIPEVLAALLVDCHAILCQAAVADGDAAAAVRSLQRLATLEAPTSELALQGCSKNLVYGLADAGRAGELVNAMVSHPLVSVAISRHLYDLVLDPRGTSTDRDEREELRVTMCVSLFAFLIARGGSATAARVAYETAAAMRSAPRRTEKTLDRALKLLSLAVNTVAVMPTAKPATGDEDDVHDGELSSTRNWSETTLRRDATTAFSANDGAAGAGASSAFGIGTLSHSDLSELRRRWQQLRCESKLTASGSSAPNCAPWASVEAELASADIEAANDTAKALIRARMWRDALVLSEAWALPTSAVYRSYAADLLEGSPDAEGWDELLRWTTARSNVKNNHEPLQVTLSFCLNHSHYKGTPAKLKDAMARHSSEAALATYLNRQRITGTILEDALELGIRFCEADQSPRRDFRSAGLSHGIISEALLDRLHKIAVHCSSGAGAAAGTATLQLAKQYVQLYRLRHP